MKALSRISILVLLSIMGLSCKVGEDLAQTEAVFTPESSALTLKPSLSLTATALATDQPDPNPSPSPLVSLTPLSTATQAVSCGKILPDNSVYLDQSPAFAVRQGPGCQYPEFSGEIIKPQPITFFNILGSYQDWLLIDLCNEMQGWIFAPTIDQSNLQYSLEQLPLITPEPPPQPRDAASPTNDSEESIHQAGETLVAFYEMLNQQNYEAAVELFGGGYGIVINWNPDVDPNDHATLLMRGCEVNGFLCILRIGKIVNADQISPLEYHFMVEFNKPDGSIFQRKGPNDTLVTQFLFRVVRDCGGKFLVVDWPFYEQYGG
jgi:hypothetical protein